MAFTINTNVASLQAQEYLRATSDFQSKTINRVTSGLRIVNAGDDAAGLAIANGFRSDQAVLGQGIRNANDGLATLQTIDSGISNISKLLDRARALAAQSSSGTFTGSRSVLNSEFSSVLGEIDRQAQAIGLNTGGKFAKSLSVFIGGGRTTTGDTTGDAAITNGSVAVDLSTSTVDAKSLGLKGVRAVGGTADLGTGTTSVQNVLANSTNTGSVATTGFTDFYFSGPGFSDISGSGRIKVSANYTNKGTIEDMVSSINDAITAAGVGASATTTAFRNAGIRAEVVTDSNGKHLQFTSSSAAFEVQAGDRVANALLGNQTAGLGDAATSMATAAAAMKATATADRTIYLRFNGLNASPVSVSVSLVAATDTSRSAILAKVQTAINTDSSLVAAGVTAGLDGSNKLTFTAKAGSSFEVASAGDVSNDLGLGGWEVTGGAFAYSSITGTGTDYAGAATLSFSIEGGATVFSTGSLTITSSQNLADQLNAYFQGDASLRSAGMYASAADATHISIASGNSTKFRVSYNDTGANTAIGFTSVAIPTTGMAASTYATKTSVNTQGASQVAVGTNDDVMSFGALRVGTDKQTVTLSATDAGGAAHSVAVSLTSSNAYSLDAAVNAINSALQQSNDTTMQRIVAVKEREYGGTVEGIRFLTDMNGFKVDVGSVGNYTSSNKIGLYANTGTAQGVVMDSEAYGTGSTADISTQANAQNAVNALATAVNTLGQSQAVVGRGQNQFNYAVSLASAQATNLAASESRIRDADLAAEAANLTKAQILQQAGIAAMAQANSAPQAILSLLRG